MTLGDHAIWHQPASMAAGLRAACWGSSADPQRIPIWAAQSLVTDTPTRWAATVLGGGNKHCRWGMYATATDLYLIPPVDESWADPNSVMIWAGGGYGLTINGPDVQVDGITMLACYRGIRLDALAQRASVLNVTTKVCGAGVGIYAGLPAVYGRDHYFSRCTFVDNGSYMVPGEVLAAHQKQSWNEIKGTVDYGSAMGKRLLSAAESVGFWTSGGAWNVLVEDCIADGTFDGASHYAEAGRFDANCDTDLTFRRWTSRNHADDALDRSKNQKGILVEDSTFENVAVVLSATELNGSVTLRRCSGWQIGEQSRVPDGDGKRPPGSLVKVGATTGNGTARLEESVFWTDTPTSQGISQDGGVGAKGPRIEVVGSTVRVGYIAVNWPYPASTFLDQGNTWATSGTRPLKTALPIRVTPAATVDARYYEPDRGNFADAAQVKAVKDELLTLRARETELEQLLAGWRVPDV